MSRELWHPLQFPSVHKHFVSVLNWYEEAAFLFKATLYRKNNTTIILTLYCTIRKMKQDSLTRSRNEEYSHAPHALW
jgi:hypothetical protein